MNFSKKVLLIVFAFLIFVAGSGSAIPNHKNCILADVIKTGDNGFICSFEGVKHDFILEMPDEVAGAPLVIMLHGYGNDAKSFKQYTAFDAEATARGYGVVYVTGAPSPEDPTSAIGWNSGIGVSEKNDTGFLCALANYMCETYAFDNTRVFAVGFSNGAFMVHRLALEANDVFSAVVSVAGMMPESVWENRDENCSVGVFQITGEKDDVIPKNIDGSAKYSKAPAIEDVIDYYVRGNALELSEECSTGKKASLEKYRSDNSDKQVWNLIIPDGRHSWPGESATGIKTNELILDFLDTQ